MARKLVADNSFKQLDKFTKAGFQFDAVLGFVTVIIASDWWTASQ